jgi:hypothetical protein
MADREGFEPSIPFEAVYTISNRAPSAKLSHLSIFVRDLLCHALAEREGFEPPRSVNPYSISNRAHSARLCHLSATSTTL